jgi:hemoglobin
MMRIPLLAAALLIAAPAAPRAADTLFDDLGGMPGLVRIVDAMTDIALVDARTKDTFDNVAIPRFKGLLVDQLCHLTGGGCAYKGRTMEASHKALKISNEQFNALVEDLQTAMDGIKVPYRTQNRLLAILAPMQRDVVTR